MNEFERLLVQQESVRLLQSIEVAAWVIVGLLAIVVVVLLVDAVRRYRSTGKAAGWSEIVENAYEAGRYDEALQTLESAELLFPRSAAVKFWQGRCYFQQESWTKAAEKFEACCRLEPTYRRSVRDYMAFIELNELVPGVSGYARRAKRGAADAGDSA